MIKLLNWFTRRWNLTALERSELESRRAQDLRHNNRVDEVVYRNMGLEDKIDYLKAERRKLRTEVRRMNAKCRVSKLEVEQVKRYCQAQVDTMAAAYRTMYQKLYLYESTHPGPDEATVNEMNKMLQAQVNTIEKQAALLREWQEGYSARDDGGPIYRPSAHAADNL